MTNTLLYTYDERADMNEFLDGLNYRYLEYSLTRTNEGWLVTYELDQAWIDSSLTYEEVA